MSWHDLVIHGFATTNKMRFEPGGEPLSSEPEELLFDIDYVLNWKEACFERRRAHFWISLATLVFEEVSDLNASFKSIWTRLLLVIYTLRREGRHWSIRLDEGSITFESAGFKQYFRREPILKSHFTYISDSESGGFSLRRSND